MDRKVVFLLCTRSGRFPWRATMADLNMTSALAAKERSEEEWYELLESAGLKTVKVWKYAAETGDSIMVAKLRDLVQGTRMLDFLAQYDSSSRCEGQ
jgi:hypothetical protein